MKKDRAWIIKEGRTEDQKGGLEQKGHSLETRTKKRRNKEMERTRKERRITQEESMTKKSVIFTTERKEWIKKGRKQKVSHQIKGKVLVPHSKSGIVPRSSLVGAGQLGFWEIGKGGTIGWRVGQIGSVYKQPETEEDDSCHSWRVPSKWKGAQRGVKGNSKGSKGKLKGG